MRAFLSLIARKAGIQIGLHTSEDGVQGLGYIFTTNPNIIIIDTTLPKYSGRELIEFLTSNPKYRQSSKSIVLTHDGYIPMDLPREYIVINKQDPQFLNKLIAVVMDILKANQAIPYAFNADFRIKWLGQFTIYFANLIDIFGYRISKHNILIKLLLFFPWLLTQVISSVLLVMLRLLIPENKDSNIEQSQRDAMRFRIRHYPTMVGLLASLLLIFVQVSAFVAGGITLFRLTDRIGVSDAAYGNGYTYRRSITIDETKVTGSSALTDFPVAIAGTYSYLATTSNGGKVTNSNGYDIIFTSDSAGSTQLDHEIERYVASSGEVVMWVRIPSLSATSNTVIYMFYGNSSVTTSQQDIEGTWNSNYKLVHHLEEGSTSNTGYVDSTSNNNDSSIVTIDGTGSSATATGKIGQAVQFDGSNDKIAVPDATSLDITGDYTISIWVKADTLPGTTKSRSVMAKTGSIASDAAGTQVNYGMGLDNGLSGAGQRWSSTFETSAHADFTSNFAFTSSTGTWYYMVSTFSDSGNAFRMYKDGSQSSINSSATGVPGTNNKDFYIGVDNASDFSSFSEYFDGTLDEVRVSTAAHSADWITTEYNNQNSPSTFYTVGSEEASATVTVSASGNQQSALDINTSNKYVGGMFIFQSNESATLTGVTIAEQGTVNGQTGLDNIKLVYDLDTSAPYDCASESYGGAETQFGSTDTDGFNATNGTSSFSGSVSLTTTQTMCAYIVLDITASPSAGETVELQITNPSTDVSLSSGTVTPGTAVAINGTSTLQVYTDVNVDTGGTQAASVSAPSTNQYIGGKFTITEKTSSRNVTGITIREQGTVDAQSHLDNIKLYYESDTSAPYDCASESYAGTESQFGSTDTDGFSATNGTSAFTGSVAISTTSTMCVYVVLDVVTGAGSGQTIDIDIANASTDVVVSASGVVGPNAAVAISGSTSITIPITLTVGTTGTQTASVSVPVTNTHIGGAFSMAAGGDTATVTGITIAEQGTINAQTNLDNIKLYYEKDISAPYDCASESYAGTETQYGSTDTDGFSSTNGTSAFTGSVAVSTTEALCVYVVLDVGSGAANGETIEIQITDPSTNVSISSGTVSPNTAVAISGDTDVINTTTTLTLQVSASTDNAWDSL
ncbi:MAG: DUF2341 domain-containing protein, partial [Candidatus Doudnabacteria bacterium]|nr:DUF2341 domain-containing protein [Candidatus Doudnabacteria bacterium]